MLLARSLLCLVFLLELSSCRTIGNFFSGKSQKFPNEEHPDPEGHCVRKDAGWDWVATDCRHIETHFVSSTIAYLRVLWSLNYKFADKAHIYKKDFSLIYMEAGNAVADAVLHSEQATFKAWYRTMVDMWEHSAATNPKNSFLLAYRESYEHLSKNESASTTSIANQFAKEFFKFIPIDKSNDFPYPDQESIDLLREAEGNLAKAFRMWNEDINQDKSDHDQNAILLGKLSIKIYSNKGQK